MKRKIVLVLLLALIALVPSVAAARLQDDLPLEKGSTGNSVITVQRRLIDLGYLHFRATGSFGDMTVDGIQAFQSRNGISPDGMVGKETASALFDSNVVRSGIGKRIIVTIGPGPQKQPAEYGQVSDWAEIGEKFAVGDSARVTDFNTLNTYMVRRVGGRGHADVKPEGEGAQTMLRCFGGAYTWEKRSVLVEIDGVKYAGSIFGSPNAQGAFGLYFNGSVSDVGGVMDVEHNERIYEAVAPEEGA